MPPSHSASDIDVDENPDWSLLTTWVLIVETGSLAQSARRLAISPAAVSQRLKLLETNLGTELIVRGTRPVRPTVAGAELFDHASRLLRQAAQMQQAMKAFHTEKRRIVRFGTVDSFAATLGPALLAGLGQRGLPEVRLSSGLTPDLELQLERRTIDLTVTTSAAIGKGTLRKTALFSERYLVALPACEDGGNPPTLAELAARLPLVRYGARSVIGHDIDVYLDLLGEHITRSFEFDTTSPMLSLVSAGLGFAITTPLCVWEVRHFIPQLTLVPMSSLCARTGIRLAPPERTFYLGYRENEPSAIRVRAEAAIDRAARRLVTDELAPKLRIEADLLWHSHSRGIDV